jgi:hypothetical protein
MLYNWPKNGVKDYGFQPDPELLAHLKGQTSAWGKALYTLSSSVL